MEVGLRLVEGRRNWNIVKTNTMLLTGVYDQREVNDSKMIDWPFVPNVA
jgi:hypothetical protein